MSIETVCFQHSANPLFLLAWGARKKHLEETQATLETKYVEFPNFQSMVWLGECLLVFSNENVDYYKCLFLTA
jgi:hypothetical protein